MVNLNDALVEKLLAVLDGYPSNKAYYAAKRLALFMEAFCSQLEEPFRVLPDIESPASSVSSCRQA